LASLTRSDSAPTDQCAPVTRTTVPQGSAATRSSAVARGREALVGQPLRHRVDVAGARHLDRPLEQPSVVLARRLGAWPGPGVRTQVVVVAAGAEEERARVAPDRAIETETVPIEGAGSLEVADVQVDVADAGPRWHARPRPARGGREYALDVDGIGGHQQLVADAAPRVARTVGVQLEPEPVGVVQVERLAHQVVAGAEPHAAGGEVADERAESGALREQQGDVVEAELRPAAGRRGARALSKLDERALVTNGTEDGLGETSVEHPQPERSLVEVERSLEVGDLQAHRPEPGRIGESSAARRTTVAPRPRGLGAAGAAERVVGGGAHGLLPRGGERPTRSHCDATGRGRPFPADI
jgi:hypothetical protein